MTLQTFVWTTMILGVTAGASAAQPPQPSGPVETTLALIARADQEPTPPPAPQPPPPAKPGPKPPTTAPPPAPPSPVMLIPKERGKDLNLQVELTISDQVGTKTPEKKVVSMVVADGTFGRIRANADAPQPGSAALTGLNVDARPLLLEGDRIRLELTIEYTPPREAGQQPQQRSTVLHESLTVILQNGKPMTVSQAADPVVDRRMSVEVRATVMK